MATDMFLKLEKAPGESYDEKHKDEIEIKSWSWNFVQVGTMASGGGGGASKVTLENLTIVKNMDKSTPVLAMHCCVGTHIKTGFLYQRKAGGQPLEFLVITMENIIVTGISHSSSGDVPEETLKLDCAKFKISYQEQNTDTGGPKGGQLIQGFDLKKNIKWD